MKALLNALASLLCFVMKCHYCNGQTADPVKFTMEANASMVEIGQEIEIYIKAKYIDFPSGAVFIFKDNYTFRVKMIMPEGFIQTGGDYSDYAGATLSSAKRSVTYTLKGKFITASKSNKFLLLRGGSDASDLSRFVAVASLSYQVHESIDVQSAARENSQLVVSQDSTFVSYMTMEELRQAQTDLEQVVFILNKRKQGIFVYDPTDFTSIDDNATTIVVASTGKRYKRDISNGLVNVEWFGAIGSDTLTDRPAFIAAQNKACLRYKVANSCGHILSWRC